MGAKEGVFGVQEAMGKGDKHAARQFLADNLSFAGPFESFDSPEPYLQALARLAPIIERVDMKHALFDPESAALFYDLVTKGPAGTAPCAEWYKVKGDKITHIRVHFDPRPFAPMFEEAPKKRAP